MPRIRSVLWIGDAPAEAAADASSSPELDLAWVRDVDEALTLPLESFDALVLDGAAGERGLDASRRLLARRALPPVVARLAEPDGALAQALLAAGVRDVWLPGEAPDALEGRLARLETRSGPLVYEPAPRRSPLQPQGVSPDIVGRSPAMREVFGLLERAQHTTATVLLTGETGTGKEILAREIHRGSERRRAGFLAVNCAAFPDTLLESELFGHVRGAFTNAVGDTVWPELALRCLRISRV
jgi:two-component system response regulator HydG